MFKVGDYVICVEGSSHIDNLTPGKSYKVLHVDNIIIWIKIMNDNGVVSRYFCSRFILDVKKTRKEKLNSINENR